MNISMDDDKRVDDPSKAFKRSVRGAQCACCIVLYCIVSWCVVSWGASYRIVSCVVSWRMSWHSSQGSLENRIFQGDCNIQSVKGVRASVAKWGRDDCGPLLMSAFMVAASFYERYVGFGHGGAYSILLIALMAAISDKKLFNRYRKRKQGLERESRYIARRTAKSFIHIFKSKKISCQDYSCMCSVSFSMWIGLQLSQLFSCNSERIDYNS